VREEFKAPTGELEARPRVERVRLPFDLDLAMNFLDALRPPQAIAKLVRRLNVADGGYLLQTCTVWHSRMSGSSAGGPPVML
jgi:hypothetical protein